MNPLHTDRDSLIEYSPRDRARALLDPGSARELLGPFDRLTSPWLPIQGIVTQSDDGVVLMKGLLNHQSVILITIDGDFQGGSLGEVGGAKIAGALELATQDNQRGIATAAIMLLESGGVRLQEANLGLAAIGDIHSAIVGLRRYQPVIGVITGPVGCYGGMSIAAGLCSYLVMTREARLGLNGPAVIEQEAGIDELDASNKPLIWSLTGGRQRVDAGLADILTLDDVTTIRHHLTELLARGVPARHRSDDTASALQRLQALPPSGPESPSGNLATNRAKAWLTALASPKQATVASCLSVQYADIQINQHDCRLIAVVPNAKSRFPRARNGEVGLEEGWALAQLIHDTIQADRHCAKKRSLIPLIDVPSQAYGRLEEATGLHQALAGAVSAYAQARLAGHRIIGLIVGNAISGAYLAHGYQAHRLIALDEPGVQFHAMGKASAARITQRTVEALDQLADQIPPMGYDLKHYAQLGLLWSTLAVDNANAPSNEDLARVRTALTDALTAPLLKGDDHLERPGSTLRQATNHVNAHLQRQWASSQQ